MEYPEVTSLFKYRAFNEHSLQAIINEAVWFATPGSFNDPFDCGIYIDEEKMEESIKVAIEDTYAENEINSDKIPQDELGVREEDKHAFQTMRKSVYDLFQCSGIYSLSSINDDILMWAHYADSHYGFCIEYSRSPENILGKQAEPVEYQNELPSLSAKDVSSSGGGIHKLWLTKSVHWEYEKEWRVINPKGGEAFQFPCDIKSIIFGLKMRKNNRFTIRRILENRNVIFKEATLDKRQFAIRISDVQA